MKKKLALLLAIILTLGQFNAFTAHGVNIYDGIPGDFEIITGEDAGDTLSTARPLFLEPGEVWTGKSVAYNRDERTVTITLYAWGQAYSTAYGAELPPLCSSNTYVTITDCLGAFTFAEVADGRQNELTQNPDNTVTWRVNQDHIVGGGTSISYIVYLREPATGWEAEYWYLSGTGDFSFRPAVGNPFYWTKEEITHNAFTMHNMNWNNGNGLNGGTINDHELGITITFGANGIPANQTVSGNWNSGASVSVSHPGSIVMPGSYDWHLYWPDHNQPKTYIFTMRNLRGPGIDAIYEVNFPRPGGNESFPGNRIFISEEYFQKDFWAGEEAITGGLDIFARIQFPSLPIPRGTLGVYKSLVGNLENWSIGADTEFTAILQNSSGSYLTFSANGTNEYAFTGRLSDRAHATVITFSESSPAILTGIPVFQSDGATPEAYIIEEVFAYDMPYLTISYTNAAGDCVEKGFTISQNTETSVTVTNNFMYGIGRLEVRKQLDGFLSDHAITRDTAFHIRVRDMKGEYYLLFHHDLESGNFKRVGNHVHGLTEAYDGVPVMEIPITAARSVFLENLWAWGNYEVVEVMPTIDLVEARLQWEDFWLGTTVNGRSPLELRLAGAVWDGSGIDTVMNNWTEVKAITEKTLEQWAEDYHWFWGVRYSDNNGNLYADQDMVVTLTNHFKYASGNLTISKALAGHYSDWAVGADTPFSARVWSADFIEAEDSFEKGSQLVFDRVTAGGRVYYRNIGYIDSAGITQFYYQGDLTMDYVKEVQFSQRTPALIVNLPAGKDKHYFVEEVLASHHSHITTSCAFNNQNTDGMGIFFNAPEYTTLAVTVTNHYSFGTEGHTLVIAKELDGYYADWGVDNETEFTANVFSPTAETPLHFVPEQGMFRYVPEHELSANPDAITDIPFSVVFPAYLVGLNPLVDYDVKEVTRDDDFTEFTFSTSIVRPNRAEDEYIDGNTIATITNTFAARAYYVRHFIDWPDDRGRQYIPTATRRIPGHLRRNFTPRPESPAPPVPLAAGFATFSGVGSVLPLPAVSALIGSNTELSALNAPAYETPWYWVEALLEKPDVLAAMNYVLTESYFSAYGIEFYDTCIDSPIKTGSGNANELHKIYVLIEDNPTEDEPTEDEPTEDEPTEDEPTEDEPTEDEPTEDEPTEDEPTEDEPTEDAPTDQPTNDTPTGGLPSDEPARPMPEPPTDYPLDDTSTPLLPLVPRPQPLPGSPIIGEVPVNMPPPGEFFIDEHIWFVRGDSQNNFRPNAYTSRADIAIVFYRLLRPEWKAFDPQGTPFNDVTGDEWYGRAIGILAHFGIIEGYKDGSFRPHEPITRKEFAAVVSRFDNLEETNVNLYTDIDPNDWAYKYILSATARGWFVGHGGRFRPDANLTRAEMVTAINRILRRKILLADIPPHVHRFYDLDESHWAYADIMEAAHTHTYVRNADGVTEIWVDILDTGLDAPYNE